MNFSIRNWPYLTYFLIFLPYQVKYLRSTVVPSGFLAVLRYRVLSFSMVCVNVCVCVCMHASVEIDLC